jgi:DHA1 family multidrug resistance protein-like MFS transporter
LAPVAVEGFKDDWASILVALLFLPGTQPTTILLHRSARLRKISGKKIKIVAKTENERNDISFGEVIFVGIIKPIKICV